MARPGVLRRLLRLRELEEEQSRLTLEAEAAEHMRIEKAMESAVELQVSGRRSFLSAVLAGDGPGRMGSNFEEQQARELRERIAPRLVAAEIRVSQQRVEFLSRRTERRQVSTLVENEQILADAETERRTQQILDDWYGSRTRKEARKGYAKAMPGSDSEIMTESESTKRVDSTSIEPIAD